MCEREKGGRGGATVLKSAAEEMVKYWLIQPRRGDLGIKMERESIATRMGVYIYTVYVCYVHVHFVCTSIFTSCSL